MLESCSFVEGLGEFLGGRGGFLSLCILRALFQASWLSSGALWTEEWGSRAR